MSKEYVLITGATGFIGSHLTEKLLLENQYHLVAIVRKMGNYKNVDDLENRGVILVKGNFYDKSILEKIFKKFTVQKRLSKKSKFTICVNFIHSKIK